MALLGVEKAFDNSSGLVFKVYRYNLQIYIVGIIKTYLSDRSFLVFLNTLHSDTLNVDAEIPQGSIRPRGGVLSMIADDTPIIYRGRVIRHRIRKYQNGLNALADYFNNWKLIPNDSVNAFRVISPHYTFHLRTTFDWSGELVYLNSKLLVRSLVHETSTKCSTFISISADQQKVHSVAQGQASQANNSPRGRIRLAYLLICHHRTHQIIHNNILRMILNSHQVPEIQKFIAWPSFRL